MKRNLQKVSVLCKINEIFKEGFDPYNLDLRKKDVIYSFLCFLKKKRKDQKYTISLPTFPIRTINSVTA